MPCPCTMLARNLTAGKAQHMPLCIACLTFPISRVDGPVVTTTYMVWSSFVLTYKEFRSRLRSAMHTFEQV